MLFRSPVVGGFAGEEGPRFGQASLGVPRVELDGVVRGDEACEQQVGAVAAEDLDEAAVHVGCAEADLR